MMCLDLRPAILYICIEENNLKTLELSLYLLSGSQGISESFHAFNDRSSLSLLPILDDYVS
jgi:hypothetical protein